MCLWQFYYQYVLYCTSVSGPLIWNPHSQGKKFQERSVKVFSFHIILFWQISINDFRFLILPVIDSTLTPPSPTDINNLLTLNLTKLIQKYVSSWWASSAPENKDIPCPVTRSQITRPSQRSNLSWPMCWRGTYRRRLQEDIEDASSSFLSFPSFLSLFFFFLVNKNHRYFPLPSNFQVKLQRKSRFLGVGGRGQTGRGACLPSDGGGQEAAMKESLAVSPFYLAVKGSCWLIEFYYININQIRLVLSSRVIWTWASIQRKGAVNQGSWAEVQACQGSSRSDQE